jgi:hypothetical protein
MVEWKGEVIDVMGVVGATPDAVIARPTFIGETEDTLAVVEAKSRVPFVKISGVLTFQSE